MSTFSGIKPDDLEAYFGGWRVVSPEGVDIRGYYQPGNAKAHAERASGHGRGEYRVRFTGDAKESIENYGAPA